MSERNAKIISTMLGRESHGIPTFYLHTQTGSTAQGFGGWDLRFYGIDLLLDVVETVGVEKWEELAGNYCRVRERGGVLVAIGHITEDRWCDVDRKRAQS